MSAVDALRQKLGLDRELRAEEARALEERTLVELYRETFRRPEGRKVFSHMIRELGLFEVATTPEETALRNYATTLVRRLGLVVTEDLANAILDTKVREETKR